LIYHSDRGSQYASYEVRNVLSKGFRQSMSSTGNCYDNATAESFFHTLKTELVYFEQYQSRREAGLSIFEYIECFYNRKRRHSSLNYLSPEQFELMKKVS
jgi:transposase InsO family protein